MFAHSQWASCSPRDLLLCCDMRPGRGVGVGCRLSIHSRDRRTIAEVVGGIFYTLLLLPPGRRGCAELQAFSSLKPVASRDAASQAGGFRSLVTTHPTPTLGKRELHLRLICQHELIAQLLETPFKPFPVNSQKPRKHPATHTHMLRPPANTSCCLYPLNLT